MKIAGLIKSSLVDYPGEVSCVVFVPGCNFDCFYCHNRTLLDGSYHAPDDDQVENLLRNRHGKLDGVVITGGEPTLQPDLIPYIKRIKDMGYKVKLDTNGSYPSVVRELLSAGLCDYYAVDYKAPAARYGEICGMGISADDVLETINILQDSGADFEVRTTVIPQLDQNDLIKMAEELPEVPRYVLNRYRRPEYYQQDEEDRINMESYTEKQIKAFAGRMKDIQPNIKC